MAVRGGPRRSSSWRRASSCWVAPLSDEFRVVHAIEADSEEEIRAILARDPWHETHLRIDTITAWTIRLDSRHT